MSQADAATVGRSSVTEPSPAGRTRRWTSVLLGRLGWAVIAGVGLSLLIVAFGGGPNQWLALGGALAAWTAPAVVVAILLLGAARRWRAVLVALAVLLLIVVWLRPYPHGNGSAGRSGAGAVALTVMTQNMLFGRADAASLVAEVRRSGVGVLVLTELTPQAAARLDAAGLGEVLPHRFALPKPWAAGTGLYSATPLLDAREVPGTGFTTIEADTQVDGRRVTLIAAHSTPPQDPTWEADHALLAEAVERRVRAGAAVVLAGDLNSTPGNRPFRRLLEAGVVDAGTARNWAWQGQTWPTDLLPFRVLRIDHVLAPRGTTVDSVETQLIDGSDHAGLVVRLQLAR